MPGTRTDPRLHRAPANAQDAHRISKSKKLFTFGAAQASRRYECIVEALKEMDGAQVIKPKGSPHELIYPFRYSEDHNTPIHQARVTEKKVSGLISELLTFYGPEPQQRSLFDQADDDAEEAERTPVLTTLPAGTRLTLLAYAAARAVAARGIRPCASRGDRDRSPFTIVGHGNLQQIGNLPDELREMTRRR